MRQVKLLTLILVTFLMVGCAAHNNVTLRGDTGRQLPNPSYTLFDTSKMGYSATFYLAAMKVTKDVDGSRQLNPEFLYMPIAETFSPKEYDHIVLVLEMWNANGRTYSLFESQDANLASGQRSVHRLKIGASNLPYRQFSIKLPFGENIKSIVYSLEMVDEESNDIPIFRIGDLHYKISGKGGVNTN